MLIFKGFIMKKYVLIVFAVMLLALTSAVYSIDFDSSQIQGLNITTDIDGALNMAKSENKTVMMVFEKDDCVYCDMFKKDVLSNSDVQNVLNGKCVVLFVDIYKHPDIANKYKVFGTPSIQFLDSNGNELTKIEGYAGADEFLNTLKEI